MPSEITIRNYDREKGIIQWEETSPFLGVDLDGKHYILREEDILNAQTRGRSEVAVPRRAYQLISYDAKKGIAKAIEVTERSLLERIALEFHQEMED